MQRIPISGICIKTKTLPCPDMTQYVDASVAGPFTEHNRTNWWWEKYFQQQIYVSCIIYVYNECLL